MAIRRLTPRDASAFQSVRLRGLREVPTAFSSSYEEEADTLIDVVATRLAAKPDGAVFGCFNSDTLVGVIGIQRDSQVKLRHKAFIWGMYVIPDHRRHGVGRLLVSWALRHAEQNLDVRSVRLGVNTQNQAAIALYKGIGFKVYGTERGFLMLDGVLYDEHLMSREIAGAV